MRGTKRFGDALRRVVGLLRMVSGDDAYERYVQHHSRHLSDLPLPSRGEFERQRQDEKWNGIKRCC